MNDSKQGDLAEAIDRVTEFLRQRSSLPNQADTIYSVHSDATSDFGADLLASDLTILLSVAGRA